VIFFFLQKLQYIPVLRIMDVYHGSWFLHIPVFTPKIVTKLSKIWVWDLGSRKNLFRIPDPGVKKAPDPGFATLIKLIPRSPWRISKLHEKTPILQGEYLVVPIIYSSNYKISFFSVLWFTFAFLVPDIKTRWILMQSDSRSLSNPNCVSVTICTGTVPVLVPVWSGKERLGNEPVFSMFLHKSLWPRSLTLPFKPFRFWLRILGDIRIRK
jgi:hypothetical protein